MPNTIGYLAVFNYINNAASDIFSLSLTWHYDEHLVDLFLQAAGFSAKQIKQIWFGKYVQYWSSQPSAFELNGIHLIKNAYELLPQTL